MALARDLDPSASPLDCYGYELRRLREAAGLKQAQLGDIIYCTSSLIGQVECTKRVPTRDFSERVDAALTEAVLHQEVGGRDVMRKQLTHLLSFLEHPWAQVQVLPFSAGQHTGMLGSFTLLRFDDDPEVIYEEGYAQGYMTANPSVIKERSFGNARLQAAALPPERSATLIARVMEERYGKQPEPGGRAVA
ncbi:MULTISPECIES: helix-turn-helix domain-containing protein [unclassified Streptomyces]|uniref:helix-turn-helix domain-containing protein n=1 Tax=unclassified Streptomyces TaxID=2593676 RepID=UPI002E13CF81|nr:helix-turn-helix transcriptional regulator [Streptomyces sp. NBC_01296]